MIGLLWLLIPALCISAGLFVMFMMYFCHIIGTCKKNEEMERLRSNDDSQVDSAVSKGD